MVDVRRAAGPDEVEEALDLRHRVFCEEQGVALAADQDGRDPDALHVVAYEGSRIVGTCRVVYDDELARLGRMAVEARDRERGIGAALLEVAEREARAAGARWMRLHAQVAARSLYERGGFAAAGDEFTEEGIPHVAMEKQLREQALA